MRKYFILFFFCISLFPGIAQERNIFKEYEDFKKQKQTEYGDFRKQANDQYTDFMRKRWEWYEGEKETDKPKNDIKPIPIPKAPKMDDGTPLQKRSMNYQSVIKSEPIAEQPQPVTPIAEVCGTSELFTFEAYGTKMRVRAGKNGRFSLKSTSENDVADAWKRLSGTAYNNLIRDCLSLRMKYNLCDWAYLNTLGQFSQSYLGKGTPEAVLMQAYLFNQSGYKVRLGRSRTQRLYMLIASSHTIYKQSFFKIKGENFYPLDYQENGLFLFTAEYPGEQTLSLMVGKEQKFAMHPDNPHVLQSKGKDSLRIELTFNENLMNFYIGYPQSHINNDEMTKWSFFANTPLSRPTKEQLYPVLKKAIEGKSEREAANTLIRFVQTAFEYQLDDIVWGEDHPFFAEETLFYPSSDCEDRAILYSCLIRDLLHLDTVLLYYPGHLAMAVCFNEEAGGKTLQLNDKAYTYCEPTCSNYAPVGWCPPNLESLNPVIITY